MGRGDFKKFEYITITSSRVEDRESSPDASEKESRPSVGSGQQLLVDGTERFPEERSKTTLESVVRGVLLAPSVGLSVLHLDGVLDLVVVHRCLLYTSPSPRDQRGSRMPSSA